MKELPDTKTLLQLLQDAKEAEEKARQLYEMGVDFSQEWESKLKTKQKVTIKPQK